ncbi:hypothetical protein PTNB73_08135 [Pyrenophora teres f. teres]|nr:hypothetical protein HRS9122_07386 [Pyrenophora teres f. teres]KAE8860525.1 hypothetical protein PTNB73_08135 [Pyrenophora teres f. teres]
MEERNHDDHHHHHQENMHDAASVVSGLSSLENEADEFEKLMIQNERDERRLSQALGGRPQAFRKARTHPRVGLTLENLERNNAAASGTSAQPRFDSPPSSGSARSGPAIHAPATWGRKGRTSASWMRTITYDEEQQQADDAMNNHSPLSHKTSTHGTPRVDQSQEWDLTFELNEASMIASTPYIPRSTKLDDIRQREIEAQKEQAVAAARPERVREASPEDANRRPPSMRTLDSVADSTATAETTAQAGPLSKTRRARTKSWQLMGKSQPVTGMGSEDPPVAMYKSTENIAAVDREVIATAKNGPAKRMPYRREDSQDLLRRLARASNTPSPQRVEPSRPSTAANSSQTMPLDAERTQSENKETPSEAPVPAGSKSESIPEQKREGAPREAEAEVEAEAEAVADAPAKQPPESLPDNDAEYVHVDATPLPKERPVLDAKTPMVTGAWVDTPGPRTMSRPVTREGASSRSLSPRKKSPKGSLRRNASSERPASIPEAEETAPTNLSTEVIRPKLPTSALQAVVDSAKSKGRRESADYGDSTINSLEELITPLPDSPAPEEDTLQGLPLPTSSPRNEAERQRQQEALHLHRMADHLRATRTSLRDASRGMKRVEDQIVHVEDGENGEKIAVISRSCPCASASHHMQDFSMWEWWKSLFWEQKLKTSRYMSHSGWRVCGGLTGLSIFLIGLFMWWVGEEIACEIYCHPTYAYSSPYPFSVKPNAPKYPYVLPTLVYRSCIRDWWVPISSFFGWIAATAWACVFGFQDVQGVGAYQAGAGYAGVARSSVGVQGVNGGVRENRWVSEEAARLMEEKGWEASMFNDEVLPRK